MKEARERERNIRVEYIGGRDEYMAKLVKDLERARDEAVMDGDALACTESKKQRLAYKIDGVKERSKGGKANRRAAVGREEDAAGRERANTNRLHNRL